MTKEDEILLAAEEEFFSNGYDATSTATIARRAGVTHAMVNYYFKNKELLFKQVLDNNVYSLIQQLKHLMQSNKNLADVITDVACTIFDIFDKKRQLPFLLCDISRTHPEFFSPYSEYFDKLFFESMELHQKFLKQRYEAGDIPDCSMRDMYRTIVTLSTAPYLALHFIQNVVGFTKERTEEFLANSRAEMIRLLKARYTVAR